MKISLILILCLSREAIAEMPSWVKNSNPRKEGAHLIITCNGTGPSLSLARKEAVHDCIVSAQQFLNHEVKVKSLSVGTESSVGFHQEVEENSTFKNLLCDQKRESVTENEGHFQLWAQCDFDLSKVEIKKIPEDSTPIKNDLSLKSIKPAENLAEVEDRLLLLETIPQCESIIIRGNKPRTVKCSSNPMRIHLAEKDSSILVRAKNHQPKSIHLNKGDNHETVQVFLEKN